MVVTRWRDTDAHWSEARVKVVVVERHTGEEMQIARCSDGLTMA